MQVTIFTSANGNMEVKKSGRGRPTVKDKRIRVSFMATNSVYKKALKKVSRENIAIELERTLEMLSVYGHS